MLQYLQYVPGHVAISMDSIAKFIHKVFKKVVIDLIKTVHKNFNCQVIVGGYCCEEKKIRVFLFEAVKDSENQWDSKCDEILKTDGTLFYGKGKTEAEKIEASESKLDHLHILKKVIKSQAEPTVGGGIQYGDFRQNSFSVCGVTDFEINPNGSFKEYLYTFAGLNLYKGEFAYKDDELLFSYRYIMPFENDIKHAFDLGE